MKTMFLTSELKIEQNDENHKSITLVVLGHGLGEQSSVSVCRPESRMLNLVFYWVKELSFPGASASHRDVKNRQETQVSTTIGHPEPHDLWGHQANIRHVLPLFSLHVPSQRRRVAAQSSFHPALATPVFPNRLLPRTLSEGQGLLSLSPASQQAVQPGFSPPLFSSNSSWRRVAASRSAHQGNLLATQALSSSELQLDVQQENLNQPLSCTTQQKPTRRFHTTSNGTATTPFSTFQGR